MLRSPPGLELANGDAPIAEVVQDARSRRRYPMKYRRCHAVAVLPEEQTVFSLESLISGGDGIEYERRIRVYSAHLDTIFTLELPACMLLLESSAEEWAPMPEDPERGALVAHLVELGLMMLDEGLGGRAVESDRRIRNNYWWPLSAIHYRHSRWDGIDSVGEMESNQMLTAQDLVRKLGAPPPEAPLRQPGAVALPRLSDDAACMLPVQRVTCRNFDRSRALSLSSLAEMLQGVLMAQAVVESGHDARFLKKNVPSGGGLHPLEAYIIARDVEGLAPGIYHYHSVAHELALVPGQPDDLDGFSHRLVAGQHWFADAPVMVTLVCRFQRNFWKYRKHMKAYRVVVLDAGHISQAVYTAATARGLGAFVTAAVNEIEMEKVLGLDPMDYGVLAVCGFGWRSAEMKNVELDPAGRIWQRVSAV